MAHEQINVNKSYQAELIVLLERLEYAMRNPKIGYMANGMLRDFSPEDEYYKYDRNNIFFDETNSHLIIPFYKLLQDRLKKIGIEFNPERVANDQMRYLYDSEKPSEATRFVGVSFYKIYSYSALLFTPMSYEISGYKSPIAYLEP